MLKKSESKCQNKFLKSMEEFMSKTNGHKPEPAPDQTKALISVTRMRGENDPSSPVYSSQSLQI